MVIKRPKIGFRIFWKLCSRGLRLENVDIKHELVTRVFTVQSKGNSFSTLLLLVVYDSRAEGADGVPRPAAPGLELYLGLVPVLINSPN